MGDAIAYQVTESTREVYDAIHHEYAAALSVLAAEAGPDAPLCVLAHSLGSVVTSNFFYDLQAERLSPGRELLAARVREALGPTPLARGETLTWLYTLGSPIALYTLRYPSRDLDRPIAVPDPAQVELPGEWVNFIDRDDLAAYPLKPLSDAYDQAVRQDRAVAVGPLLAWRSPLAHPFYWTSEAVMAPIADALAEGWRALNDPTARPMASVASRRLGSARR
jgi:hypothetical protein